MLRLIAGFLGSVILVWAASLGLVVAAGALPQLRPADAIIVLGAAQYNGRPSPVLKARLDHALALYRQGLAPRIVVTGGVGKGDTLSEGEVALRYAMGQSIPDSAILVDRAGETSAQSMAAAAELLHARGLSTALIVSDAYHMLRLELLARRFGIRPYRAPAPETTPNRTHVRRYYLRESVFFPGAALLGGR
jgi:uncharacterized SAM-binding protein YcdF (DUF218 family)